MLKRLNIILVVIVTVCLWGFGQAVIASNLPGFLISPHWNEQVTTLTLAGDSVRVLINAPAAASFDPAKPTRLILYALPNGNSIEWTIGKKMEEGDDWHYDIQHVGAQARRLREVVTDENIIVAYLEAKGLSWPNWRKTREYDDKQILPVLAAIRERLPMTDVKVMLTGHSGGGSLTFGLLNAVNKIPSGIDCIAFLDSNYGFDAKTGHGEKLLEWLRGDAGRRLLVVAYDDREITLNGKKVVSDTGGTWRATHRMIDDFTTKSVTLAHTKDGDFDIYRGMNGQIQMFLHRNPENKILHTVLVGEMNGLIHAATLGTKREGQAAVFGGPRAYGAWVQNGE